MERLDKLVMRTLETAAWFTSLIFFCWGLLLIASQCLAWLRFGTWQPIPAFVVFMRSDMQRFNALLLDRTASDWTPLDLAPSIAAFESSEAIATAVAGRLIGLGKLVSSALEWPLSVWFFVLSIGLFTIAVNLAQKQD